MFIVHTSLLTCSSHSLPIAVSPRPKQLPVHSSLLLSPSDDAAHSASSDSRHSLLRSSLWQVGSPPTLHAKLYRSSSSSQPWTFGACSSTHPWLKELLSAASTCHRHSLPASGPHAYCSFLSLSLWLSLYSPHLAGSSTHSSRILGSCDRSCTIVGP